MVPAAVARPAAAALRQQEPDAHRSFGAGTLAPSGIEAGRVCRGHMQQARWARGTAADCGRLPPHRGGRATADLAALPRTRDSARFISIACSGRPRALTPRAYADAHRTQRMQQSLATAAPSPRPSTPPVRTHTSMTTLRVRSAWRQPRTAPRRRQRHPFRRRRVLARRAAGAARRWLWPPLGDDPDMLVRELHDRFRRAELVGAHAAFEQSVARLWLHRAPRLGLDLPLSAGTASSVACGGTAPRAGRRNGVLCELAAPHRPAPREPRGGAGLRGESAGRGIPCPRVVRTDGDISAIAGAWRASARCSSARLSRNRNRCRRAPGLHSLS